MALTHQTRVQFPVGEVLFYTYIPPVLFFSLGVCTYQNRKCPLGSTTGGSSAVEQWTVKCNSAAIHWSGVQISLPGYIVILFVFAALNDLSSLQYRSSFSLLCVHSTRVVFNPSKVEIRVRVPMNASCFFYLDLFNFQ